MLNKKIEQNIVIKLGKGNNLKESVINSSLRVGEEIRKLHIRIELFFGGPLIRFN